MVFMERRKIRQLNICCPIWRSRKNNDCNGRFDAMHPSIALGAFFHAIGNRELTAVMGQNEIADKLMEYSK